MASCVALGPRFARISNKLKEYCYIDLNLYLGTCNDRGIYRM